MNDAELIRALRCCCALWNDKNSCDECPLPDEKRGHELHDTCDEYLMRLAAERLEELIGGTAKGTKAETPGFDFKRQFILSQAEHCVCGKREQDYGSPEDNFGRIAEMWAVYMRGNCVSYGANICIAPKDVAAMMALLKIARIASGNAKADNWIDLAGYAACGGELEGIGDDQPVRL